MSEKRYFKKIAKLQYKVEKFKARAKLLREKNRFKKAGKFEGKAQHFENKIPRYGYKLQALSEELKAKESILRTNGKTVNADILLSRIKIIDKKVGEIFGIKSDDSQQIVVKEIIKTEMVRIPCNYCGTLNDITDKKCSSCGGSIGN